MSLPLRQIFSAVFVIAVVSCGDASGPDRLVVMGRVDVAQYLLESLTAPDTVRRNAPFSVTVTSWGSNGCTEPHSLDVRHGLSSVTLTPFDYLAPAGATCTDNIKALRHTTTLSIRAAGTATLWVRGRVDASGTIDSLPHVLVVIP